MIHDTWMEVSPLIDNFLGIKITNYGKYKSIIDNNRTWNISKLNSVMPEYIFKKIATTSIPVTDVKDKLIWILQPMKNFQSKNAT